ncbi:hypothetical protein [Streptomyces sp. NPDC051677]|uniref:hypothetical protein n=1 Tax=Streptomyces sp. NPDC051677 TaxID=3365669 RepID=UPI0037D3B53F
MEADVHTHGHRPHDRPDDQLRTNVHRIVQEKAARASRASQSGGALTAQMPLALQRTIGNAAVARLLEPQQRHTHGPSGGHEFPSGGRAAPAPAVQRSALHDVPHSGDRVERVAEADATRLMSRSASPAVARPSAFTTPAGVGAVQRTVSDDITPPAANASAAVPDLTDALVTQLATARNPPAGTAVAQTRKQAMEAVLNHVLASLPATAGYPDVQTALTDGEIVVQYDDTARGAGQPTADTRSSAGNPVTMTFFRDLFAKSEAVIYSTLRHELIHVAQTMRKPDPDAIDANDPHIYLDNTQSHNTQTEYVNLQLPMQEIETHVWELEHAGRTRVDTAYVVATVDWLRQYTQNLTRNIKRKRTSKTNIIYWRPYLNNSVAALLRAATAAVVTSAQAALITSDAAKLQAAIDRKAGRATASSSSSSSSSAAASSSSSSSSSAPAMRKRAGSTSGGNEKKSKLEQSEP